MRLTEPAKPTPVPRSRVGNISFGFDNKISPVDRIAGALEHTYFYRDGFREFGKVSGTIDIAQVDWLDFLNATANGADAPSLTTNDPAETIAAVQPLLDDKGITLLDPSSATDQNAFFVTQQYAEDKY